MWTNLDLEGHHGFPLVIGRGGRFSASSMVQHEKGPQKGLNFKERLCVWAVKLAGEPGFEPRQTESESVVLPLHHSPFKPLIMPGFLRKSCKIWKGSCKFLKNRRSETPI